MCADGLISPIFLACFPFFVWFCGSSFVATSLSFCLISFSPLWPPLPPSLLPSAALRATLLGIQRGGVVAVSSFCPSQHSAKIPVVAWEYCIEHTLQIYSSQHFPLFIPASFPLACARVAFSGSCGRSGGYSFSSASGGGGLLRKMIRK